VEIGEQDGELRVLIADDGPGGAVATGSGLTGLRQRVDALDGRFDLASPAAGGTRVEVVLPCGS
nr:two-component sensor histidine kinase [Solirubrobacterales bacterium]